MQRFGALVGAGVIGVCLALHSLYGLTVGLLVVSALGVAAMVGYSRGVGPVLASCETRPLGELLRGGYRTGIGMLRRPGILVAAMVGMGLNVIFIETNSFIPLIHGHGHAASALFVSGSLATRDILAIVAGLVIARKGLHVGSRGGVVTVLTVSALAAVGMGLAVHVGLPGIVVAMSGLQGLVAGVGIAGTNLYTIAATAEDDRALGMAASAFATRSAVIIVPLVAGVILSAGGVEAVFYLCGGVLACLGLGAAIVGSQVVVAGR